MKFGRVFLIMRAKGQTNKQTDRHTDTIIAILLTPAGAKQLVQYCCTVLLVHSPLTGYYVLYSDPLPAVYPTVQLHYVPIIRFVNQSSFISGMTERRPRMHNKHNIHSNSSRVTLPNICLHKAFV